MKKVSFRIRRIYFDQIVDGSKTVELRQQSEYWRKILFSDDPPVIAVFVCGHDVHLRHITQITEGVPAEILGRELSDQGKLDVPGDKCFAVWLGEKVS